MSEEPAPTVRVSENDRDYMRRLGEFEAENARRDLAKHRERTLDERLEYSWRITRSLGRSVRRPDDSGDSALLYERARRLGLIVR